MKFKQLRRSNGFRDLAPARPENFFLVDLMAATPKSAIPTAEHPFFGLSKNPWKKNGCVRRYESPSGKEYLELSGDQRYGLPTIFDQDFLIYAVSAMAAERKKLKDTPHASGRRRVLNNIIQFSTAEFADFTHRTTIGKDGKVRLPGSRYEQIEAGINRLVRTTVTTNIVSAGFSRTDLFGILDSASIERRELLRKHGAAAEALVACRIKLSDWILAAIEAGHLITLDRRYFDLRSPLDRRLYQIIRKHCGQQTKWEIGLPKLYLKSGSLSPLREFRRQIRQCVARWDQRLETEGESFLGYQMVYDGARDMLTVRPHRPFRAADWPLPFTDGLEKICRRELPGYDPADVFSQFNKFAIARGAPPRNVYGALTHWCRQSAQDPDFLRRLMPDDPAPPDA